MIAAYRIVLKTQGGEKGEENAKATEKFFYVELYFKQARDKG